MPKDMSADARIEVTAGQPVELPNGHFIANAEMTRDGMDLHLTSPDGHTIVIEGYFAQNPAPDLVTADGAHLSPQMVDAFLPPEHAGQYASSGQIANDASPAGKITEIVGEATIIRADGTRVEATTGTPVYQGDVVETSKTGAVNILFSDNTTFAISESARLSVDQFVYNAGEQSGTSFFSMLQGMFVYTSGLIGKTDAGSVNIETPVGSIGIRGTVVAGQILPAGQESTITILDGAIALTNGTGTQELNTSFQTVSLTGYQSQPVTMQMDAQTFNSTYQSMSAVANDAFTAYSGGAAPSGSSPDNNDANDTTGTTDADAAPAPAPVPTDAAPAPTGTAPAPTGTMSPDGSMMMPPPPTGTLMPADGTDMMMRMPTYMTPEMMTKMMMSGMTPTMTNMMMPPPDGTTYMGTYTTPYMGTTDSYMTDMMTMDPYMMTMDPYMTDAYVMTDPYITDASTYTPPPPALRFNFAPFYLNGTSTTTDDGVPMLGMGLPAGPVPVGQVMFEGFSTPPVITVSGTFNGTVLQPDASTPANPFDTIQDTGEQVFVYDNATRQLLLVNPTAMLQNLNPDGTFTFTAHAWVDGVEVASYDFTVFTRSPTTSGAIEVFIGDPSGVSNDTISGTAGNDLMIGREGNDTVNYSHVNGFGWGVTVNLANTFAQYTGTSSGTDTILGFENLTGSMYEDMLVGNDFSNVINGGLATDMIFGGGGNDILDGGDGLDTMHGGMGDDRYFVSHTGDQIIENFNAGYDRVEALDSYTLTAHIEELKLMGSAISGTGNDQNNSIYGNAANNIIEGGGGNDSLFGGDGNDTVSYAGAFSGVTVDLANNLTAQNTLGAGTDFISGFENLTGSGYNDFLYGDALNNEIRGGAGDDIIKGGGGVDIMWGGADNDTYDVTEAGDVPTENAGEGYDTVNSFLGSYALTANVEHLNLMGTAISGMGNALGNTIIGNDLNNTLNGGAGMDTMSGGMGDDIYIVDDMGDIVIEGDSGGMDEVQSSVDHDLSNNVERLVLTGSAIHGGGNTLNNFIYGNSGNNTIDGWMGIDTMQGFAGNDTYYVDNTADIVIEGAGMGIDTVISTASYILSADVEHLTLTGTADINGTGNGLANTIIGNSGNNFLQGFGGSDTIRGEGGDDTIDGSGGGDKDLDGGDGFDTLKYLNASAAVTIDLMTGQVLGDGGPGYDTISGFENVIGSAYDDIFIGDGGNNIFDGGGGNDTLSFGTWGSAVWVDLSIFVPQNASVGSGLDTYSSIENLTGSSFDDILKGNDSDNTIFGEGGNDTIDGGGGNDNLFGGLGNDTLSYASAGLGGVTVNLTGGFQNTINAGMDTISSDFENLEGSDWNDTLTGDIYANQIWGGWGQDMINGGGGADQLWGGEGDDTFIVKNFTELNTLSTVNGGANNFWGDTLRLGDAGMSQQLFDFTTVTDPNKVRSIEWIELTNSNTLNNGHDIKLNIEDVFQMTDFASDFTLIIDRAAGNGGGSLVTIDNSGPGVFTWQSGTLGGGGALTYTGTYSSQTVTLVIQQGSTDTATNGIAVTVV